ncbi:MAG: carboxynorspermidine decarboxylase, partial [Eggerthellaceae bacterium]|nr:carboxynorspermidine decarboxylase [Eggerthellaceae bacterium]
MPFHENHVYSPAYKRSDIGELARICDHITFNSLSEYDRHIDSVLDGGNAKVGLRVNPEFSTQKSPIYDPCSPGSRLGITASELEAGLEKRGLDGLPQHVSGLHMHTLCEQGFDDLELTYEAFEKSFGKYLDGIEWLNLGGGHHITREGYDIEGLIDLIRRIRERYGIEVYLEPGEAVALNAGYLVSEVLDVIKNGMDILIIDASAACHMPDVLEMPYRPEIMGAGLPEGSEHAYRIGGPTCLASDVIGDYGFDEEMTAGKRIVFEDMAIYTMVKNNTFNGTPLPSIALLLENGDISPVREFGYEDFKGRLS